MCVCVCVCVCLEEGVGRGPVGLRRRVELHPRRVHDAPRVHLPVLPPPAAPAGPGPGAPPARVSTVRAIRPGHSSESRVTHSIVRTGPGRASESPAAARIRRAAWSPWTERLGLAGPPAPTSGRRWAAGSQTPPNTPSPPAAAAAGRPGGPPGDLNKTAHYFLQACPLRRCGRRTRKALMASAGAGM